MSSGALLIAWSTCELTSDGSPERKLLSVFVPCFTFCQLSVLEFLHFSYFLLFIFTPFINRVFFFISYALLIIFHIFFDILSRLHSISFLLFVILRFGKCSFTYSIRWLCFYTFIIFPTLVLCLKKIALNPPIVKSLRFWIYALQNLG